LSENNRKSSCDTMMSFLNDRMEPPPGLESKYIGLTMPFPQEVSQRNTIIESIEGLIDFDKDVCIAVNFTRTDDGAVEYNKIIFLGNDYSHLNRIVDFMNRQQIELSIENKCILYREFTADLSMNLKGNHSVITSLNDLFAMVEIRIDPMEAGMGYTYENKIEKEDIIHYCCHKEDMEAKELGYRLFIKSLDCCTKRTLADGFVLGYPAVDSKITILDAHCTMCFYREYYYVSGAHGSLKKAMRKADWHLCEPVMEIRMICNKLYFERNGLFKKVESLHLLEEKDDCKLSFTAKISSVIDYLDEFYNNEKDIWDFYMKIYSYAPVEDDTRLKDHFKIIYDVTEWKEDIE